MRVFATFLGLLLVVVLVGRANAEPEGLAFRWSRDASASACASSEAMTDAITERLEANPFTAGGRRSLEGLVERRDGSWRVRLALRDADGNVAWTRDLASRDAECTAATKAAALAVAALLAPDVEAAKRAAVDAGVDAPIEAGADPIAIVPPPPPPPPPPPAPLPPVERTTTLELGVLGAAGILPAAGLGVSVGATRALGDPLRLELGADWLGEVRTTDDRFAFGLVAARLGLCGERAIDRVSLAVCARAHLGVVHGTVYVLAPSRPGERAWVGLSAGPELRLRLVGPLALTAGVGIVFNVLRYAFVNVVGGNDSKVFEQPVVGGQAHLGVGLVFP